METDIGNPIEYKPEIDILSNDNQEVNHPPPEDDYYYDQPQQPPQQMMYMTPPPPPPLYPNSPKSDFFSGMDKNVIIVAFAVFLLGFFMGKTMQPVILRYT